MLQRSSAGSTTLAEGLLQRRRETQNASRCFVPACLWTDSLLLRVFVSLWISPVQSSVLDVEPDPLCEREVSRVVD